MEERGKERGGLTEMEVGEKGNRGEDRKLGSEPEVRVGSESESGERANLNSFLM